MNWKKAIGSTLIIFILSVVGIKGFNFLMSRQIAVWSESDFELGLLPRALVALHTILQKNELFILPVVLIICVLMSLSISIKK